MSRLARGVARSRANLAVAHLAPASVCGVDRPCDYSVSTAGTAVSKNNAVFKALGIYDLEYDVHELRLPRVHVHGTCPTLHSQLYTALRVASIL